MMGGNQQPSIDNSEHIGVGDGENINAKRVGNYQWGTNSQWARTPLPLIDGAWDYVSFTNPDANGNYQTWTFKNGGSGGTTVRTLTVGYDGSNNITSIARS